MEGRGICASEHSRPLSGILEVLNTIGSLSDTAALIQARTDTKAAYNAATAALEAAKTALEDCHGVLFAKVSTYFSVLL